MIIVEGPDGSGKTILIKDVVKRLQLWVGTLSVKEPVKIVHSPGPLEQGLFEWAANALLLVKEPVVFDRFPYFSDIVYGPTLRKQTLMTESGYRQLKTRLKELDPLVIYCRPPVDTIVKSSKVWEQMKGVPENLTKIVKNYDQQLLYWMSDFKVFHYDFTQPENKKLLMTVIDEYVRQDYRRVGWGSPTKPSLEEN